MSDGSIDGVSSYMGESDRELWTKLMEKEVESIKKGESTIPDYGATNNAEFLAVVVTYYKECPKLLKVKHRQLYELMERIFSHK
jgi:Mlc titration factor MtfA (ptsG expression regulator)